MKYLAHTDEETKREQTVQAHLTGTAELASTFASAFGAAQQAYQCGMLHDIGKYSEAFQRRIKGSAEKVDHSTAGAQECRAVGDVAGALCIAGHHGGIPNMGCRLDSGGEKTLLGRLKKELENYSVFRDEICLKPVKPPELLINRPDTAFFYTHMLFSCLVDADWLDTERFMKNGAVKRSTGRSFPELEKPLETYISDWWKSEKPLNIKRCEILRALIDGGNLPRGLYTLTVPTGGGKTVSSMAFALKHALKNKQQRIIYVIPYTSIIEQTQAVFENIFGSDSVVAHYANVGFETNENGALTESEQRRYLATENWDAPVIVTTAVQFFESLMGNKPSCCRKLHNIAESVIIFDEAQMLPVNYLNPCVWAITELVKNYGCSAVLCTATQPALEPLIKKYISEKPAELCPNAEENYEFFRRVVYKYDGQLSDEELAMRLSEQAQVLCIVNSRVQAQKLFSLLPEEGRFHLSTTMTPAHRRSVLVTIKDRLKNKMCCRVVSTSLVEAGVDVDFPTVYRALAGLDSVIQAGGRCNRENKRPIQESVVHIFDSDSKIPRGLEQNVAAARQVMREYSDCIDSPKVIEKYFGILLYTLKGEQALDEKSIMQLICKEMAFETVAREFKLIEEDGRTIYIPVDEGKDLVARLIQEGACKSLMRQLGQYAVSVRESEYKKLIGALEPISPDAAVLLDVSLYSEETGLSLGYESGQALFG